ncbi:MAG: hypothetical protein ACKPJ4_01215, partial [Dolichospermum sp.]
CFGLPFGVIGWLWSGFCLLVCLGAFLNPTINKKTAQQIQEIKNKADADKFNAEKLGEHLKNAAGVVVGVGILAAIFGLGIGIGSSWFGD